MQNGLGLSITDIPIISRAVNWADTRVQRAVETILQKYAEFERAAMEAPAILQDAMAAREVIVQSNGTPIQRAQADRYVDAAQKLVQDVASRGPVDQVVQWATSVRRSIGMGALPAVPFAVAGAALAAVVIVTSAMKSYNEAQAVRALLAAGATPEQIARWGARRSPFASGAFGFTSAITLVALAAGAYFIVRAVKS